MKKTAIIFLSGLSLVLVLRALSPNRYSEWAFGDAQTVLAVDNWRASGFLATYFLWIPQGYSAVTRYFDDPDLSHHAQGVSIAGRSYRAYTHYPGWYAVPYGVLAKLGITTKRAYHLFALLVSLAGLYFFFCVFAFQEGKLFALVASTVFLLHETFLGYCDSLNNIPYDDLFKFWIFYRWQTLKTRKDLIVVGILYFFLCITSFDSFVLVPIFIVAYDLFFRKIFAWKRYMAVASAGLLAMAFLVTQNAMYFGSFNTVITDWTGQVRAHFHVTEIFQAIHVLIVREFRMGIFSWAFMLLWLQTVVEKRDRKNLYFGVCLLLSGLAYAYIFPSRVGGQRYVHRLLSPFMALVWATLLRYRIAHPFRNFSSRKMEAIGFSVVLLFSAYHTHIRSFPTYFDFPPRSRVSEPLVQSFGGMHERNPGDKVYFEITRFLEHHGEGTQVSPLIEEAAKAPILFAENVQVAVKDSLVLWRKTSEPFSIFFLFPAGFSLNLSEVENVFRAHSVEAKARMVFSDVLVTCVAIVR